MWLSRAVLLDAFFETRTKRPSYYESRKRDEHSVPEAYISLLSGYWAPITNDFAVSGWLLERRFEAWQGKHELIGMEGILSSVGMDGGFAYVGARKRQAVMVYNG